MTDDLKKLGFEQSHADPCVFRKDVDEQAEVVAVIHVDDILVASKWSGNIDQFVADLRSRFKIKDLGKATCYMGSHISRNRQKRELKFDQLQYVQTTTDRFGTVKTSMIPAAAGSRPLSKEDGPQSL